MTFGEKLKKARKEKKLTQKELAQIISAKHNSISNWENDQNMPDPNMIEILCGALGVTPTYLLSNRIASDIDKAPTPNDAAHRIARAYERAPNPVREIVDVALRPYMSETGVLLAPVPEDEDDEPRVIELPLYTEAASAGLGNYLSDAYYEMTPFPAADVPHGADMCIRIRGDSMEPDYPNDCIVYVKACPVLENGQIGIFSVNGEAYCKKLRVDHDRRETRLVSLNPDYEDILIRDSDNVDTKGRVLGVAKE